MNNKKFIVNRSKWKNANHGTGYTYLLNKEGYRCCLGFVCNQLGIPDKKTFEVSYPAKIGIVIKDFTYMIGENTSLCINDTLTIRAMSINDNQYQYQEQRENDLIDLFREYGYTLEFEGSYE